MRRYFVILMGLLMAHFTTNAQIECGIDEYMKSLIELHPELEVINQDYREQLKNALQQIELGESSLGKTTADLDTTTQYTVPIVFHVLHTYGGDWIADNQIIQCVSLINEDFNGCYPDTSFVVDYFKDKVGNGRITFKLANKDPYGNCTNGINRIYTNKAEIGGDQAKMGQWPPEKYINIWVADVAGVPGAAAYAIGPSTASILPYRDGVMSASSYVGGRNIGTRGHTIAHELAHIFSVSHIWGPTNNPDVACGDDDVEDTPPTKGHEPVSPSSLCGDSAYLHQRPTDCWDTTTNPQYSIYFNNPACVDNVQNIMDYSYCYRMFTRGQMQRVRGVLQNINASANNAGRENLITQTNLVATGTDGNPVLCDPKADFNANTRFMMQGSTNFIIRNFTYNTPLIGASYSWSSPNANPSSSNSAVNYFASFPSTTGWQDVSLEANVGGRTGNITKSNYLFIQKPEVARVMQDFEDDARNYYWPTFNYTDNDFYWEVTTNGAYNGSKCIKYQGFDSRTFPANTINTASYDEDDFYSEAFEIPSGSDFYLNFWLSGAARSSSPALTQNDKLTISFSTNGGASWFTAGEITGADLYPNGVSNTEFTPGGYWDYSPVSVKLPAAAQSSNTIFRFRMNPGDYSNNVYMDNIELAAWPTSVNDVEGNREYNFSPNPLSNSSNLLITSKSSLKDVRLTITDLTGKLIYSTIVESGQNSIELKRDLFPSAGLYLVNLEKDGVNHTEKLSVL